MAYVTDGYVDLDYVEILGDLGASIFDSAGYDSAGEFVLYRNGYYDKSTNKYYANCTEVWDSNNDSSGYVWDDLTTWDGTSTSTLIFLTNVVDSGKSRYYNPIVKVEASGPVSVWVYYGDTLDSTGAIETPNLFVGGQNQTLLGAKARYWQFGILVEKQNIEKLYISNITTIIKSDTVEEVISNLDTSTVVDSTGYGTIVPANSFSTISSVFIQPQADGPSKPIVYVRNKSTAGIDFEIFDADTYGKTHIDTTVDVRIQGLPKLISDAHGNIVEELA